MTDKIVVFSTCGSEDEARKIAAALVEQHLAACVNILPPMTSVYRWKGQIESATEWLLVIKSGRELFEQLRLALEGAHSYELPEVIAIPIVDGSPNYMSWMEGEIHG